MSEWYYSKDGAQVGPVSDSEIKALLANGTIDAQTSLVWKTGMADWLPAGHIPELVGAPAVADPYAAPASGFEMEVAPADAGGMLPEITPGSESIDPMACVKRAFDLAVRNIGIVLLATVVWVVLSFAVSAILSALDGVVAALVGDETYFIAIVFALGTSIVDFVFSIFLMLGATRMMLNVCSGREISVGQLFSQGHLVVKAFLASILFYIAVGFGLVLLIFPGIYIALRYGLYMTAIVDRNCGIMQSFEESSRLTTNNRVNLFLLSLISLGVLVLGCLALFVGLLFAYPLVGLSWVMAYLWLRYGHRAAMDHPGTTVPMLKPQAD